MQHFNENSIYVKDNQGRLYILMEKLNKNDSAIY
jgi:hypothetical protein